jgi:hypothetical protein
MVCHAVKRAPKESALRWKPGCCAGLKAASSVASSTLSEPVNKRFALSGEQAVAAVAVVPKEPSITGDTGPVARTWAKAAAPRALANDGEPGGLRCTWPVLSIVYLVSPCSVRSL